MRRTDLPLEAYYYSFTPTGCQHVDLILSAVACAGAAAHHTEGWTDDARLAVDTLVGNTPEAWIQNAAANAATELTTLRAQLALAVEALKPFTALARAVTDDGSPELRSWVSEANDWTVAFAFAGHSITIGQLRALAAIQGADNADR